jgi:hypothetical protein
MKSDPMASYAITLYPNDIFELISQKLQRKLKIKGLKQVDFTQDVSSLEKTLLEDTKKPREPTIEEVNKAYYANIEQLFALVRAS